HARSSPSGPARDGKRLTSGNGWAGASDRTTDAKALATGAETQLHLLLFELIPGGAKKDLSAARPKPCQRRCVPAMPPAWSDVGWPPS
ncbi:MAG TPA: hypothetical protein VGJ59_21195, partial [Jatrophihabitantaceae bacterium]